MKIRTASNDNFASADIDYQPSLCFEPVYDYLSYVCEEDDKSIFDGMSRKIALFIDMLFYK
jgi:hypothetical protein